MALSEEEGDGRDFRIKDRSGVRRETAATGEKNVEPAAGPSPEAPRPTVRTQDDGGPAVPLWRRRKWVVLGILAVLIVGAGYWVDASDRAVACPDEVYLETDNPEARCGLSVSCPFATGPDGRVGEERSCPLGSDGSLIIALRLEGGGSVTIAIDDPSGDNVFYATYPTATGAGKDPYVVVLDGLRGEPGTWTVRVTWHELPASGKVVVWA